MEAKHARESVDHATVCFFPITPVIGGVVSGVSDREKVEVRSAPQHIDDLEGYGGTYSRIDVPKRVILLTEKYGEIDVRLREKGPSTLVSLRATKLAAAAEEAQWRELIDRVMERFVTPEGDFPHG